jgi:hypothetical protein
LPAARIEVATALEILEGFDGLPSLKRLQAHLNLDPENAPITQRGWKEANRDLLAADPAITASIGAVGGCSRVWILSFGSLPGPRFQAAVQDDVTQSHEHEGGDLAQDDHRCFFHTFFPFTGLRARA